MKHATTALVGALGLIIVFVILVLFGVFDFSGNDVKHVVYEERELIHDTEVSKVNVLYPFVENVAMQAVIDDFIDAEVELFEVNASDAAINNREALVTNPHNLAINYSIEESPTTITYVFVSAAFLGGTNVAIDGATFTFNLEGERIELPDLFMENSDYLNMISSLSRSFLYERFGGSGSAKVLVDSGTIPELQSFDRFFVTNNSLNIIYPPDVVAPLTSGAQVVEIALADLKDILNEDVLTIE